MRVELEAVPGVEEQRPALEQHTPRLAEELRLLGHEHDAQGAHHDAKGIVLEGQRRGVREPPVDLALHLVPRVGEHRFAEIRGDEPERGVHALAQPLRQDPGAARELEHIALGPHRQPAHQVRGDRFELRRTENRVVVLRHRAAEIGGDIDHPYDPPSRNYFLRLTASFGNCSRSRFTALPE